MKHRPHFWCWIWGKRSFRYLLISMRMSIFVEMPFYVKTYGRGTGCWRWILGQFLTPSFTHSQFLLSRSMTICHRSSAIIQNFDVPITILLRDILFCSCKIFNHKDLDCHSHVLNFVGRKNTAEWSTTETEENYWRDTSKGVCYQCVGIVALAQNDYNSKVFALLFVGFAV